jgi:EAL domain-containing protein (putative c-di-GMP-specific phosphodiesterase class I)
MEAGLRQAIARNELRLVFQPQVDHRGQVAGAEVLLRWQHPERGNISPIDFIPVAEETGLIHAIGAWVFDRACWQLAQWRQNGVPFQGHLAVNFSPWQFSRPDFVAQVVQTLARHQVDPARMVLELTETALLYDLKNTISKLKELRALGLGVSLDDFGTGYASLAYLKDLPLDQLKIDQAFVKELAESEAHPLVESMIAIGHHMQLAVIAEGVETGTQRDILTRLGCRHFQGFLYSTPLPEQDFLAWLARNQLAHTQTT